ncbi:MAG: sialidase family protein, partial [Anaerolineae bacterium]
EPKTSHISLAIGPTGSLYLAWNEPGTGRALWSWSSDGGETWIEPQLVNPADRAATLAHVSTTTTSQVVMLWQGTGSGTEPVLYSNYSPDGGYNWTPGRSVLPGVTGGSANLSLVTGADGRVILVSGGQASGPVLAAFGTAESSVDGQPVWSDPVTLPYSVASAGSVTAAGVPRWSALGVNGVLVLAGEDKASDIWELQSDLTGIGWTYSGMALWSDEPAAGSGRFHVLSESGAVSPAVVIPGEGATRQAYWWDALEGLVSANADGDTWYARQPAEAYTRTSSGGSQVPPFGAQLVGDGNGSVGAFWVDTQGGNEGPLRFSLQRIGQHTWTNAATVTEVASGHRAVVGPDGSWWVLFARVSGEELRPAGIYFTYWSPDATEWTVPVLIAPLPVVEGMSVPDAQLDLASNDTQLHATWLEPGGGGIRYSGSLDGGLTWTAPVSLSEGVAGAEHPRVATLDERVLVLYQSSIDEGFQVYQATLDASGTLQKVPVALRRVDANTGPQGSWRLLGQGTGQVYLAVAESAGELSIARWSGQDAQNGWETTQPVSLIPPGQPTDSFEPVSLIPALQSGRLTITSIGSSGQAGVLELTPSGSGWETPGAGVWSWPQRVSALETGAGRPLVQIDDQLRVHVMWSASPASAPALWYARYADGGWTQPGPVIQPQEGVALDPSLLAMGERVYAVWSGGDNGRVDASWAFATDAYAAASWPLAEALPGPVAPRTSIGAHPALAADLSGTLHAIYAVPINQYRGIYYTRSLDQGDTWTPAARLFDAAASGWTIVDEPTLAVDHDGTLYAAWLRADLAGASQPRALYLARSGDQGRTWTEPRLVAEGRFSAPTMVIAATGQPHLLWQDAGGGRGVWHSWSADKGQAWSLPMRVRGFSSLAGSAGVVADGRGAVYLAGVQADDAAAPSLLLATWDSDGQQWVLDESAALPSAVEQASDAALAVAPAAGQLVALMVADLNTEQGSEHSLLYSVKAVAPRDSVPEWTGDVEAVVEVETRPTALATPTTRATIDVGAPPSGGGAMEIGPLTVPILSLGGLVLVALLVAGVMIARGRARR